MEAFKFFNSAPGDARTYQAADFADYFGSVLSTGLLHTDNVPGMVVSVEGGTLNTVVSAGKAIMKGHLYENTAPLKLAHSIPEASLDRIDRIVLRLDLRNSERNIKLHVKEGVPSAIPVAPALQRDNFIYEIALARITLWANTSQVFPSDLVDERLDENLAGLVHSLISIPTSQFQAQWDAFMEDVQDSGFASGTEFAAHKAEDAIDAHNASNISVLDTAGLFTSINVEGALKESIEKANSAFTSASNGKTVVKNAVTGVDPTVVIPENPTFQDLADGIGRISTGLKSASGTATSGVAQSFQLAGSTTNQNLATLTVTGLDFTPDYIYAVHNDGSNLYSTTYEKLVGYAYPKIMKTSDNVAPVVGTRQTWTVKGDVGAASVTGTGFVIPVQPGSGGKIFNWLAIKY